MIIPEGRIVLRTSAKLILLICHYYCEIVIEFLISNTSIPKIFFLRWMKGDGARGFVNMSDGMSTVIKCFITSTNFSCNSLIKLYLTPICLVFLPLHLFSIMLIVDLLSSYRIVGFSLGKPMLARNLRAHKISLATMWVAINSAAVDESAVFFCYVDFVNRDPGKS